MSRHAPRAVALSLGSLPFLLPHVLEDFARGIAARAGLSADVGAALLGAGLAIQMLGVVLTARGRRAGLVVIAAASAVWTLGALWDHGLDLAASSLGFRSGPLSVLWLAGLMLTQALACCFAALALRSKGTPWPP